MMEKVKLSGYLFLIIFFGTSCDVLVHNPQDAITPEQAFESESSVRNAMTGLYDNMQSENYYGGFFQYLADNYADISTYNGFYTEFQEASDRALPVTNVLVENIWLGIYRVINTANELISGIPEVNDIGFTEAEQNALISEAKCIRALAYLDLLVHFGEHWDVSSPFGIPLVFNSTNSDYSNIELIARNTVQETYDLILNDLTDAENGLTGLNNRAFVTIGLAQSLLARTYLHLHDYQNALYYANLVLGDSTFTLNSSYTDIFQSDLTSESVFELTASTLDPTSLALYTIARSEVVPEEGLKDSFEESDARRSLIGSLEGFLNERFLKAEDYAGDGNPAYIMRISEIYLYRAEANYYLGNTGDALDDLNLLRERSGLSVYNNSDNFLEKYLKENRWELFAEGKRFATLTRIGTAQDVLGIEDFRRIYPIPFREFTIEGNLLVQNPGY